MAFLQPSPCYSQVSESIKFPAQLSWRLRPHKYQRFPCYNVGISRSYCNRTLNLGIEEKYQNALRHKKRTKSRSTKTIISASLPVISSPSTQLASSLFTFGTAFVVPFYTVMIVAPHAKWTKKLVESSLPYVVLGIAYAYLLYLSWSPETLHLMFASKYWLPELPGITKMFSSVLTVASAWIHLLAVDLFAGRQIYLDGCQHALETRHSLVLCLLFCPIGILCHYITKAVVQLWRRIMTNQEAHDKAKMYN